MYVQATHTVTRVSNCISTGYSLIESDMFIQCHREFYFIKVCIISILNSCSFFSIRNNKHFSHLFDRYFYVFQLIDEEEFGSRIIEER
jgi:hypothetical protein